MCFRLSALAPSFSFLWLSVAGVVVRGARPPLHRRGAFLGLPSFSAGIAMLIFPFFVRRVQIFDCCIHLSAARVLGALVARSHTRRTAELKLKEAHRNQRGNNGTQRGTTELKEAQRTSKRHNGTQRRKAELEEAYPQHALCAASGRA